MSLYEYKHPVINKDLVAGPDSSSKKQFPTLEAWYDVVNDYEFQARCPIILKNSHRNKHFTFACHLKSCPFKVLLSYSGNSKDEPSIQRLDAPKSHQDSGDENNNNNTGNNGGDDDDDDDAKSDSKDDDSRDPNRFNDDVSAAIAAAVAAVTDGEHAGISIKGPFTVTKIDPYHNHPLESNLSLAKFVLTKIPRILQNDLKFDSILESLCNDDDNTVAKFRVSQYVEESGILDILKERYGLSDADLDKKLLSHIARRITTYKARFVLKKKKAGTYGLPNSPLTAAAAAAAAIASGTDTISAASVPESKRVAEDVLDEDAQGKKRIRANKISTAVKMGTRSSLVGEPGMASLEDGPNEYVQTGSSGEDKLPHDVAEQWRLLSSHLKEVEQQQQQEHQPDEQTEQEQQQQHQQHQHQHQHQQHQQSQLEGIEPKDVNEDIPDENIQPELRGQ